MTVFRTTLMTTILVGMTSCFALAQRPDGQGRGMRRGGPSFERLADRFDANKDGKITKEEFTGREGMFKRMDTNNDGVITKSDLANMQRRQGRRGGQEGGGAGRGGMFGQFPTSRPAPGQVAPNFELRTPEGEKVALGKLLFTKPVVLEFGSFT